MSDLDKVYERVLEMQKNIETASPEEQIKMMNELLDVASQIELSLNSVQDDIKELNEVMARYPSLANNQKIYFVFRIRYGKEFLANRVLHSSHYKRGRYYCRTV